MLPSGPRQGRRFSRQTQPFAGLYLDQVSRSHREGLWNRYAVTGPRQTGKSTLGYVTPAAYHLFEIVEDVILAAPDMGLAAHKWAVDILPVIECSRYRDALPLRGAGSHGGKVDEIHFRNGATLMFMTAGGGDKSRVGPTARVLIVTEADGFDAQSETSREADKFTQMEYCTAAFGDRRQVYLECTVSIPAGRIWREYQAGTASRIVRPCPHCRAWVTPEREHLSGWQRADSEQQARREGQFLCPACAKPWTDEERRAANAAAKVLHRGQQIDAEGTIVGDTPATSCLGFRWSAVDNHFTTAGQLAVREWKGAHSHDRENAEKELKQFVWALPYEPPRVDLTPLDAEQVVSHVHAFKRGVVPDDCMGIGVGVDTNKRVLHWVAAAARESGGTAILEYGQQETDADRIGITQGLAKAFSGLKSYLDRGWRTGGGKLYVPSQVWGDSGWHEHRDAVYEFCRAASVGLPYGSECYRPVKGYGEEQNYMARYHAPTAQEKNILYIGRQYHLSLQEAQQVILVHLNADYWKSRLHQGLAMPVEEPLAVLLYQTADPIEHEEFGQEITAEVQREKWIEGRGNVIVWERVRRRNHFLDASDYALAACDFIRSMIVAQRAALRARNAQPPASEESAFTTPDGSAYLVTER